MAKLRSLFASWVAPVAYVTARAYVPTELVLSQLNMVHRVALDVTTWHLMMPILALPAAEGGLGQVGLVLYVQCLHSHTFLRSVTWLASLAEVHTGPFRRWASRVGLVMEPATLPYLQLALIPLSPPLFLQGYLKAYSVLQRGGSALMNTGHSALPLA